MTLSTTWIETTEERYDEMLGVLPPEDMTGLGFLVGEPSDHNEQGRPRYAAFVRIGDRFFESAEPLTIREFRAVKLGEVSP
jgi:hypothetical protein